MLVALACGARANVVSNWFAPAGAGAEPVPPRSAMIGGLFIASGSWATVLFGSENAAPNVLDVTTKLPLSPTADCSTTVCPQDASVVVDMQRDTGTAGPPVEKDSGFAPSGLRQFDVAEKNAVTVAWAGKANPSVANAIAASVREVFIRFILFLFAFLLKDDGSRFSTGNAFYVHDTKP